MKIILLILTLTNLAAHAADLPVCGKDRPTSDFTTVQSMFKDVFELTVDISHKSLLEDIKNTGSSRSQIWLINQSGVAQLRMKSNIMDSTNQASFCRTGDSLRVSVSNNVVLITKTDGNRFAVQIKGHPEYDNKYDLSSNKVQVGFGGGGGFFGFAGAGR